MNDTWLRDALHAATARQPSPGEARASGALHRALQRRRQRLAAASFAAVTGVFLASTLTGGTGGSAGLHPVAPNVRQVSEGSPAPVSERAAVHPPAPARPGAPLPHVTPVAAVVPPAVVPPQHPQRYRPLDVYFLVDTTADMFPSEKDVTKAVASIAAQLGARADLRYGYGRYSDFAPAYATTPVYERWAALGHHPAPMPELVYKSGGVNPEPAQFGLDGALGITHPPYTTKSEAAGFVAGRRGVIVLITSAPLKEADGYPSAASTIANLRDAGVSVAALHVIAGTYEAGARPDLDRVAGETGARTDRVVDCDGDGYFHPAVDLRKGAPLVCELAAHMPQSYGGFADAILRLALIT